MVLLCDSALINLCHMEDVGGCLHVQAVCVSESGLCQDRIAFASFLGDMLVCHIVLLLCTVLGLWMWKNEVPRLGIRD